MSNSHSQKVRHSSKQRIALLLSVLIFSLLGFLLAEYSAVDVNASFLAQSAQDELAASSAPAESDLSSFIPFVIHHASVSNKFGIDMSQILPGSRLDLVEQAGFSWVRKSGLFWGDVFLDTIGGKGDPEYLGVERVKGVYNWDNAAWLEDELIAAEKAGLEVVLLIQSSPWQWAASDPDRPCSIMRDIYYDEFGDFVAAAIERYSGAPYFVNYYEIWNEPDIDPSLTGDLTSLIGCWGKMTDLTYYGGREYGNMLKTVYPIAKAANPDAQIIVGGLLMDCDPVNPPASANCTSSKYFKGIMESSSKTGGNYFDGVSFHAYDYYWGGDLYYNTNWPRDGVRPVMVQKYNYLKSILESYGYTNKYFLNTEAAVICDASTCSTAYENVKKAYVAQVYAYTYAIPDIRGTFWYSLEGWRSSGLLTGTTPRPAYYAADFAEDMLRMAKYIEEVTAYSDVYGFKFTSPQVKNLWIVWSLDGASHTIDLPAVPLKIWDSTGNTIAVNGTSIDLIIDPVYIQMP